MSSRSTRKIQGDAPSKLDTGGKGIKAKTSTSVKRQAPKGKRHR